MLVDLGFFPLLFANPATHYKTFRASCFALWEGLLERKKTVNCDRNGGPYSENLFG